MKIVAASGAQLIVYGVHKQELHRAFGVHAHSPHTLALQYCLERVNYYAETQNILDVHVITDKVDDPNAHEAMMHQYKLSGATQGYFQSDFAHIVFPFKWEDSRHSFGLQAVDMALYMLNRAARINRDDMSTGDKQVMKIVRTLSPNIQRSSKVAYLQERKSRYILPELTSGAPKGPRADNN
ncbi:hypothetical protein KIMH_04720 [Bombiscardovia apis]|uniref:DUF3800 domain-containing protein n=1 Tax=Bombiscardovia apis TaxID=2932182 RepID=A0ABM8BBR4_9BIFI|nr:DUF3800 domain-containing protein [Bombiscardovia apis]BDR54361.1 hypothetical protein KIMH_04720 [Bombiscardovia apis]